MGSEAASADWGETIIKAKLLAIALWSKMPGRDFDRPWAAWMLEHDWLMGVWEHLVEWPLTRLCCLLTGHEMEAWDCFCLICGKRSLSNP